MVVQLGMPELFLANETCRGWVYSGRVDGVAKLLTLVMARDSATSEQGIELARALDGADRRRVVNALLPEGHFHYAALLRLASNTLTDARGAACELITHGLEHVASNASPNPTRSYDELVSLARLVSSGKVPSPLRGQIVEVWEDFDADFMTDGIVPATALRRMMDAAEAPTYAQWRRLVIDALSHLFLVDECHDLPEAMHQRASELAHALLGA